MYSNHICVKKYLAILLFFGIYTRVLFSQDTTNNHYILSANGHYGFGVPHNSNMNYLIKRHIGAFEINFGKTTSGEKEWQRVYNHPEMGLGILYTSMGNPYLLGQGIGAHVSVNFPLNQSRKVKLVLRVCQGIGYLTKPYERIENHKNNILGTRFNGLVGFRLNSVFNITKKIRMESGISFTHFSNGAWSVPNLGINLVTANLGFGLNAGTVKKKSAENENISPAVAEKKSTFFIIVAAGPNELSPPGGKKYGAYSISGWYGKKTSPKHRFGVGGDLFYNVANIEYAKRDTTFEYDNDLQNLQAGIKVTYEFIVGKVALPLDLGVYLLSKQKQNISLYHRIGIRYFMTRHLILNYSLKTHFAQAETFEFGLGWKF